MSCTVPVAVWYVWDRELAGDAVPGQVAAIHGYGALRGAVGWPLAAGRCQVHDLEVAVLLLVIGATQHHR